MKWEGRGRGEREGRWDEGGGMVGREGRRGRRGYEGSKGKEMEMPLTNCA